MLSYFISVAIGTVLPVLSYTAGADNRPNAHYLTNPEFSELVSAVLIGGRNCNQK